MKFSGLIAVSDRTMARLEAAAIEHDITLTAMASQICDAAGRLYIRDERTSAMPAIASPLGATSVDPRSGLGCVPVAISDPSLAAIASAAQLHGMSIEAQLRAILDAAVNRYDPNPTPVAPATPAPKRRAFDAAWYARHAVIPETALAETPTAARPPATVAIAGALMQRRPAVSEAATSTRRRGET